MKSIVILYHSNCPDGFGAAWVAWKKLGNRAEYISISATQDEKQLKDIYPKGKTVYFLDVCPSPEDLRKLTKTNKFVTVVDHHETNKDKVVHASNHIFDLKHSGSVLSWMYFYPGKKIPKFLKYVEAVDLWKFDLPGIHELTTYAYSKPFGFKIWSGLARDFESAGKLKHFSDLGMTLLEYERNIINSLVKQAELVKFEKHKVLAVDLPLKKFVSFVGHELCKKVTPFGISWYVKDGDLNVSLRGNGTIDVSKIAKKFLGGGGHKNAAGFTIPFKGKFPWKLIKEKSKK